MSMNKTKGRTLLLINLHLAGLVFLFPYFCTVCFQSAVYRPFKNVNVPCIIVDGTPKVITNCVPVSDNIPQLCVSLLLLFY